MANQAIALQARAPQQGNFLAPAIQQAGQIANRMAQQQALDRQTAAAEQALKVSQAGEARAAAKAPFELAEAIEKALTAQQKNTLDFYDLVAAGVKNSSTPDQVMIVADFLKKTYPGAAQQVDQEISDMPSDPAAFNAWRESTMLQSLDAKDQLTKEFTTQNLGTSTRVLRTPKFGGGAGEVVPGSEAAVTMKPTVVNVEGIGAVIVDPNTGQGYPAAAGATGGYRPPVAGGGIVGGPRGGVMPAAPMGAPPRGTTPVATALQTNPGAIKDGSFARSQPGYAGASGGFATFDTPQAGIGAQENLLRNDYVGKGINTIDKIISRYAPPGGENAPAAVANYKNYVAQRSGIDVNAPITAAQVPVLAAAMREFETGARPGGTPVRGGAAAPAATQTLAQTAKTADRARTVTEFKNITGTDFTSKTDPVADLIKRSTSGGGEKLGADIMGFIPESMGGGATPGMEAIGALEVIGSDLTLALLPGNKLGAGVSNEDRKMFEKLVGEMQNPSIPAGKRLAAWGQLKTKMARIAGVETPPASKTPTGERRTPTTSAAAPPTAAIQMLRKNPTPTERKLFDSIFGAGAAAKALGSR
jgi:hypothetical protein